MINEWCFLHPHTFYLNEEENYTIGGTLLLPCNKLGIPAQGGINDPQSNFLNHAIIEYEGKYYDPSYGTTKESTQTQNDWEDASLAGFGTEFLYPAFDNNGVQKRVSLVWIQELNTAGVQTTFTNY